LACVENFDKPPALDRGLPRDERHGDPTDPDSKVSGKALTDPYLAQCRHAADVNQRYTPD
jgi:hypothetical protein